MPFDKFNFFLSAQLPYDFPNFTTNSAKQNLLRASSSSMNISLNIMSGWTLALPIFVLVRPRTILQLSPLGSSLTLGVTLSAALSAALSREGADTPDSGC
jgi:hypothetical protein